MLAEYLVRCSVPVDSFMQWKIDTFVGLFVARLFDSMGPFGCNHVVFRCNRVPAAAYLLVSGTVED